MIKVRAYYRLTHDPVMMAGSAAGEAATDSSGLSRLKVGRSAGKTQI
jgi:hypothetical protein